MSADISSAVGPSYGFGLYIHWPYCTRICPYCDFNVYAAKQRDTAPLVAAMLDDLKRQARDLAGHPKLSSIFFGGGTPSLLTPDMMAQLVTAADDAFGLNPDCEITLEANPNDILTSDLAGWAAAGINRVSLGIQSFDDTALKFLGRDHDGAAARQALDAMQAQFSNHSFDLIYALPDQTVEQWRTQLEAALSFGAPHLSLYELTIKPATVFGKQLERGELLPASETAQADLYECTQTVCTAAGLPAYEVSNHARHADFEAKHNHIYWASGDWLGLGPGAHGRLTQSGQRYMTEARAKPAAYMLADEPDKTALSANEIALEFLAMALRPVRGLDRRRYVQLFGHDVSHKVCRALQENGLIILQDDRLTLTPAGRLLTDYIAGQLV